MRRSLRWRAFAIALALCCASAATLLCLPLMASGAEGCANAAFRTGPSAALPDCRAYEVVTPPLKNGANVVVDNGGVRTGNGLFSAGYAGGMAADGESVRLYSFGAFAGAESTPGFIPDGVYLARRSGSGWSTVSLDPPASQFTMYAGFGDENLSSLGGMLWEMRGASQQDNSLGLYLVSPGRPPVEFGPGVAPTALDNTVHELAVSVLPEGVSGDGSRVIFHLDNTDQESEVHKKAPFHWPFEATIYPQLGNPFQGDGGPLLEYVGTGNHEPLHVGVDNEGKLVDECPFQQIGGTGHNGGIALAANWTQNAISADGETVFFNDRCKLQLFARIANGRPGAHTVAISEPSSADCSGCAAEGLSGAGSFDGASVDGSTVFFTRASNSGLNVYEYDFDAPEGRRVVKVTAGDGTVSEPAPQLGGVVQVSPDGSHVYFVARGVLSTTSNYAGLSAQPGKDNLYLYERDARYPAGRTVFVATLASSDSPLWGQEAVNSDVTPDGRFLVMISHAWLTADDSSVAGQVFEYDSQSNTMVRVSKGQGGFNNDGNTLQGGEESEPQIAFPRGYSRRIYVPAAYTEALTVSADGSYVFFASPVALTAQALNFTLSTQESSAVVRNVYEYHDGNVYLISDGQDTNSISNPLVGTDLSGRDVLFYTADSLVAQVEGGNIDVYDARAGGGFSPPPPVEECSGDACQGLLGAAPVLLSPGSELQRGGENAAGGAPTSSVASPKAKVKKKARKKRARTRHRARKSSRRAHGSGARGVGGRS
jgi:hypothetical protein